MPGWDKRSRPACAGPVGNGAPGTAFAIPRGRRSRVVENRRLMPAAGLQFQYVLCLQTLGALYQRELNRLALVQGAESVTLY